MLDADPDDLVIRDGTISEAASGTGVALAQLAMGCYLAPDLMPAGVDRPPGHGHL